MGGQSECIRPMFEVNVSFFTSKLLIPRRGLASLLTDSVKIFGPEDTVESGERRRRTTER